MFRKKTLTESLRNAMSENLCEVAFESLQLNDRPISHSLYFQNRCHKSVVVYVIEIIPQKDFGPNFIYDDKCGRRSQFFMLEFWLVKRQT